MVKVDGDGVWGVADGATEVHQVALYRQLHPGHRPRRGQTQQLLIQLDITQARIMPAAAPQPGQRHTLPTENRKCP